MKDTREVSDRIGSFTWWLIVAILGTFLLMSQCDPFTVDAAHAILPLGGIAALAALMWLGQHLRRPGLALASEAFVQMTLFTVLGVVLAYAIAARGGNLWDDRLAAADRALGIDWPVLRALLDRLPPLVWLLGLAYNSLVMQMIVAIVALSHAGRAPVLRVAIGAAILSGFVTILASGLFPARGNLFDPAQYRHLWPSIAWRETALIDGLRDGSIRVIDLGSMAGIVTFPSFHATLSLIFIWAFGQLPRGSVPAQCWAGLTIVATPVFGGHYAVDVLAGLALAPPAIIAMHRLARPPTVAGALVPTPV